MIAPPANTADFFKKPLLETWTVLALLIMSLSKKYSLEYNNFKNTARILS
jgi:hypothetical protein